MNQVGGPASGDSTVADLGEFSLISQFTRGLQMSPAVSLGPGDDAAVFLVNGSAVCSVDMLVEGVHFRRDWSDPTHIGRKAVAVNVADLEAMGAFGVSMVVALGAPPELSVPWVREFSTGLREEAEAAGVVIVGGDVTAARDITISVTVIGETRGLPVVTRSGAAPEQLVAVRGRLGWSAAGHSVLSRGFRSPRVAVEAHRVPQVPYGQGSVAAMAGATAMIDVSDGLLADLGHVARASGVTIDLDSSALPIDEPLVTVAAATGVDPLTFVLSGGDDHALVACFTVGDVPMGWTIIGRTVAVPTHAEPTVLVDGELAPHERGWEHFRT